MTPEELGVPMTWEQARREAQNHARNAATDAIRTGKEHLGSLMKEAGLRIDDPDTWRTAKTQFLRSLILQASRELNG